MTGAEKMAPLDRKPRVPFEDPVKLIPRILSKLFSIWVSMTYPFASIGSDFSIHYTCSVLRPGARRIKFGSSIVIAKDARIHVRAPLGEEGDPVIVIDDGCVLGIRSTISAKNFVHLERDVMFGPGALIQDHNHAYQDVTRSIKEQGVTPGGRITIGEGSFIGHGAVIHCDGGELKLGRNCLVAANSVVTKSFPSHCVIAGNPAIVVKHFDPVKAAWVLGSARGMRDNAGSRVEVDTTSPVRRF